jgi:hypothetical protein
VHSKRTDITARKLERLHGESVGRDEYVAAVQLNWSRVGLDVERFGSQVARKYFLDELAHEAATVTVCEGDAVVFHYGFLAAR